MPPELLTRRWPAELATVNTGNDETIPDLDLIIPCLNEEFRLPATLHEVVSVLQRIPSLRARIIVVDNGSSDRTAEVADAIALSSGVDIRVLGCARGGKGAAVRRGMLAGQADLIGFIDADLAVQPSVVVEALRALAEGEHVVIASRRCSGGRYEVPQPRVRRLGGWAFRRSIGSLVPEVADTQCGFKFFSREAAVGIFSDLDTGGFTFDVELLLRARALGYRIRELPVSWSDQSASTLRVWSHAPEIAREIVRLRRLAPTLRVEAAPAAAPLYALAGEESRVA